MFCMGCGAETPPHAAHCPVCGRDLGRTPAELARTTPATSAGATIPPAQTSAAPLQPASPAIRSGDLDRPGFPRDTLGRSLILTAVAMSADLVVPWVNLDGQHIAPASYGLPAVLIVALLGLAALPVTRPDMRRRALYASFPLVIGAMSFGAAAFIWLRMLFSERAAENAVAASGGVPAAYGSDAGLYLFLVGAGVLVVAGYQVLVAAAAAEAMSAYQAAQAPAVPARAPAPVAPAPQIALADGASLGGSAAAAADGAERVARAETVGATAAAPGPAGAPLALPGTAAWTEAPQLPGFIRPSPAGGWSRQRHVRRN